MKKFAGRKVVILQLDVEELVEILHRHGYLADELCPDDVVVSQYPQHHPNVCSLTLESDQLPDRYAAAGQYRNVALQKPVTAAGQPVTVE
jgi:hypothetical protein